VKDLNTIYCNEDGEFFAKLNGWEQALLKEQMDDRSFVGWLRNGARKDWALCVPYELAGTKAFYLDFIVVRRKGKQLEDDILEPHDYTRTDTRAKAKGLAVFADDHGLEFGRLLIARKKDAKFQVVDVNKELIRDKARKMQASNDLAALFV
jgi:type III restriction enzyme